MKKYFYCGGHGGSRSLAVSGMSLIELLLAVGLIGLISVVLAQTFSVGIDAYHRGQRTLKTMSKVRAASNVWAESVRSLIPDSDRIRLAPTSASGSSFNFVRQTGYGPEENGFALEQSRAVAGIQLRREWPASGGLDQGGQKIPLIQGVSSLSFSFRRPDRRALSEWPVTPPSDSPPRLVEMSMTLDDGRVYPTAAYVRIDAEVLWLKPESGSTGGDT